MFPDDTQPAHEMPVRNERPWANYGGELEELVEDADYSVSDVTQSPYGSRVRKYKSNDFAPSRYLVTSEARNLSCDFGAPVEDVSGTVERHRLSDMMEGVREMLSEGDRQMPVFVSDDIMDYVTEEGVEETVGRMITWNGNEYPVLIRPHSEWREIAETEEYEEFFHQFDNFEGRMDYETHASRPLEYGSRDNILVPYFFEPEVSEESDPWPLAPSAALFVEEGEQIIDGYERELEGEERGGGRKAKA